FEYESDMRVDVSKVGKPSIAHILPYKNIAESISTSAKCICNCVPMTMIGGSQTHPQQRTIAHLRWKASLMATDMERRCAVEEFIAEMNLSIHNTPDAPPTFCSQMGESCIDVTLSSSDVSLDRWRVLPDASCSDHRLIVYEFVSGLPRGPTLCSSHRLHSQRPFGREGAEIMSDTFTYCADIAFGRGSLTSTRRCDWWNNYLVEQLTGFAFDEALIAFRVARSRYRASVEKAKGNLLRRVVQRLDSEGPWSPLYHEFKANRSVDLASYRT
ncbi:hypothetical protein SFRURICE_000618, partial [Spodoptera frugiperda]